jgi:hypothetical protein
MVVGSAKRLIRASITEAIDMSHDLNGKTELSLGISAVLAAVKECLAAIKDAGTTEKGAGVTHKDAGPAIKDSLIAIKESLIVRRRSGETVVLGRFRCYYWNVWLLVAQNVSYVQV